jgi:UDP-glucose:(heptosyl)LPS alpha-1,3-glucosyltransferase
MRVALVLERFVPGRGGLERWAVRFAHWLVGQGHDVSVVTFELDEAAAPRELGRHLLARPPGRVERAHALAAALESLKVDVVHDFGVGYRCDLLHVQAGSRRTASRQALRALPLRQRLRGRLRAWLRRPLFRREDDLERRQYAADGPRIVAASRMVKAHLVRDYGVGPDRIAVVPNGVDPEEFTPAGRARHRGPMRQRLGLGDAPTFLFVGHNYYLKGLPSALRALARLARQGEDVRLCVVGRGPTAEFARLADRLGVSARVHFAGGVDDPRPWYAAADVLLHPTYFDTCSLVVLEAWAMGLPAITSRWNGVHELWPPGHEGWLVKDPGDVADVARAMRESLEPAHRTAAAAGRAVALTCDLASNFAGIVALYREIVRTADGARR